MAIFVDNGWPLLHLVNIGEKVAKMDIALGSPAQRNVFGLSCGEIDKLKLFTTCTG
jgi:hypothetical protein